MKDLLRGVSDILILTHQNADIDALGSAIALKRTINSAYPGVEVSIGVPKGASAYSARLLEEFEEEVIVNPALDSDLLFILDTPTLDQLAPLDRDVKTTKAKIAVIDHHASHPHTQELADFYLVEEKASSTAEVLYPILKDIHPIDDKTGLALLAGIVADSGHFRFATNDTLHAVSQIVAESGAEFARVFDLIFVAPDISQRIAHLKAASRAKVHRVGDWLIVTSFVKAFGSSGAGKLLVLGADCALVASREKDEARVHCRASRKFILDTNINMGAHIMPEIGRFLGGSGGGHAGAAGAKGKGGDEKAALKEALRMVEERIGTT